MSDIAALAFLGIALISMGLLGYYNTISALATPAFYLPTLIFGSYVSLGAITRLVTKYFRHQDSQPNETRPLSESSENQEVSQPSENHEKFRTLLLKNFPEKRFKPETSIQLRNSLISPTSLKKNNYKPNSIEFPLLYIANQHLLILRAMVSDSQLGDPKYFPGLSFFAFAVTYKSSEESRVYVSDLFGTYNSRVDYYVFKWNISNQRSLMNHHLNKKEVLLLERLFLDLVDFKAITLDMNTLYHEIQSLHDQLPCIDPSFSFEIGTNLAQLKQLIDSYNPPLNPHPSLPNLNDD